jgi:hypothetical protein
MPSMKKQHNPALLKEMKEAYSHYKDGSMTLFDQDIGRIALQFTSNPMRVSDNIQMTLLSSGIRKIEKKLSG